MTDERTQNGGAGPDRYDDDRLLAFALDLDDDPELLAAAEADPALAARLAAVRADVETIGAQVRTAVPAPDESYTDLSGDRWSGLSGFFQAPAERSRGRRRWWRVLAPVAAVLVLAVVVGIVAVYESGQMTASDSGGIEAGRAVDEAAQFEGQDLGSGDDATGSEAAPQTAAERLAEQLDHFAVVVLARARAATGALQRFAVVRIFKGDAPQVVELDVDDEPAHEGRLHLLMLDPVEAAGAELLSPEPLPALSTTKGDLGYGTPLTASYSYEGKPAMAREFTAGTDPASVELPLP
jgi:hypothetical protein